MMRAIAEYIVRGRSQAIIVALVGSFGVPLLTQATLSLVTLRKGGNEGLLVLMWALLPALAAFWFGDVSRVVALSSVAALVISLAGSMVLRLTVSWPAALAFFVTMSALSTILTVAFSSEVVAEMRIFTDEMKLIAEKIQGVNPEDVVKLKGILTVTWSAGWIALMTALHGVISLIIARWWQATLFNPGGFRKEFHALQLNLPLAVVSGCAMFYCRLQGAEYYLWSIVFGLPLLVAGLGLMHSAIAKYRLGGLTVALAYMGLLLPPVQLLLALFGLTDVWLDYRKKFKLMQ